MKTWNELEGMLTEANKRLAALELMEEVRQQREALLYPALKTLCRRKDAEDCYDKAINGPHNRPIILPALLDEEDAGGVWNISYKMLSDEEKREYAYIKGKQLALMQRVAARRAKRWGKHLAGVDIPTGLFAPKKSDDGKGDIA